MATGQKRVAVAREDNLALLCHLEVAVNRALWLREHRSVGGTTAAAHGAAATMHEHEVDIVLLCPFGDTRLRGVERERSGRGAGIGLTHLQPFFFRK